MEKELSVAGGGLAGLACAIRLRERGWRVAVHERGRYPPKKVCGEFLSPGAWARVVSLGADRRLSRAPLPLRRARFYADARAHVDFPLEPPAYGLSRAALDQALADRFRELGGELHEGSSLDPSQAGVVDATGRPPAPGGKAAWMGWKAYLPADRAPKELDEADLIMVPLERGYAGLSRIEDGRVSLCLVARSPVRLPALLAGHPLLEACAPDLEPHAAIAGFEFSLGFGSGLGSGLGFGSKRVGDARRVFPPLVGDGMAQALRDGEALARRLDGGGRGGEAGALARYGLACALHALMLWDPGRRKAVEFCARRPGLAGRLYAWSRG